MELGYRLREFTRIYHVADILQPLLFRGFHILVCHYWFTARSCVRYANVVFERPESNCFAAFMNFTVRTLQLYQFISNLDRIPGYIFSRV
jgi:hypothetical protein